MSSWTWLPRSIKWHEQLVFALAFIAWIEGRFIYSDFVRGVAVGLALCALLVMIAGRYAAHAIGCAGLVVMSYMMTPSVGTSWVGLAAAHTITAMMLLLTISSAWYAHHLARRGLQVPER